MMFLLFFALQLLTAHATPADRFLILAPKEFHEGVKEKVFVQMGQNHLNKNYVMYLEGENSMPVSDIVPVEYGPEDKGVLIDLMINQTLLSMLKKKPSHVKLVAESSSDDKHETWVKLSPHRGYIFMQTNQPVYKPKDKVKCRIFTLDHKFRPFREVPLHLSLYNAAGHRVMKSIYTAKEGVFERHFVIPDVAKTGTWKVKAHYEGDAVNAVSKEFKVQKYVMPTFDVDILMDHKYVLVKATEISFRILARYSHLNSVNGAYHCQIGVIPKGSKTKPTYIRGVEQAGSVKDGIASLSVNITKLNKHIENQLNQTFSELEERGYLLYLGVFVTDLQNGEIQEQQLTLPIVTHKYKIDLARTRSYFIPGFPVNVAVMVRLPDGSPAEKIPINMTLMEETCQSKTDQQGAVFYEFNTKSTTAVTLTVSVGDSSETKVLTAAQSPSESYLYMSVAREEYSVGKSVQVMLRPVTPNMNGVLLHYLVLSRGSIVRKGHMELRQEGVLSLQISDNMVPSFRLIGYFYTQSNDIISASMWLGVKDNCEDEDKVKVNLRGPFTPRSSSKIDIDLKGKEATVALLAVDTALYSLNTDNKLTSEQVHSSMEAYDPGSPFGSGEDPKCVIADAGLAFSTKNDEEWRTYKNCHSTSRQKRSVDLEQEMMSLKSKFEGETLQSCCARGFLLIPMQRTCEERAQRVSQMQSDPSCTEAFLSCCREGQRLREQKSREEAAKGLGRTASLYQIQEYFLNNDISYIRRVFESSIDFKSFFVNGAETYNLTLPDSITTWEIQIVTLSKESGLCVLQPSLLRAFKPVFVSLRFPYSVRKYEQMQITPVIYNYDNEDLHVAVHMEQSEGLCSPGSATSDSFVNITVKPDSSQMVTFSAVPMRSGLIPIRIRLYDINREGEIDAIEKSLNVWAEGVEQTEETTIVIHLNETNGVKQKTISGKTPDDTVPDSTSNIFITLEDDGFGISHVRNLLTVSIPKLTIQPHHCLEQTSSRLVPTALAVYYLDASDQWISQPPGARNEALKNIQNGITNIKQIINAEGRSGEGYGSWPSMPRSTWLTSHVVKVLSFLRKRQVYTFDREGRKAVSIPVPEITDAVRYLRSQQNVEHGSFSDGYPVLHRNLMGKDAEAAITAFVTLALSHSLALLQDQDRSATENVISKARNYLWSNFNQLDHPLAVAITAYALSVDNLQDLRGRIDWSKFETTDTNDLGASAVETSAYALLTAVALKERQQAHALAHWLTTRENSLGGFYSSQDTLIALEALAEYELMEPVTSEANIYASFTVKGKNYVESLVLENKEKVEKDLKRFVGNEITANFQGRGKAKFKVMKVFHLMEPKDICNDLSIEVTVKGKVRYTAAIQENYEYYEDEDTTEQSDEPREHRSDIEWFDIRTRRRRDINDDQIADQFVTYEVCVKHSPSYNLSGMAIVDITLLSGFEAEDKDLEDLKAPPEQYISHFELSHGKVLIYLNQMFEQIQCFEFSARQLHTVRLLQPAPAVFYDYYEPSQKCTVFYSAPKRSKVISKLCSGDVCQCAERPCHKLQNTFGQNDGQMTTSERRQDHACLYPIVDYAYMVRVLEVSEKNNFELYKTEVTDVLRMRDDPRVTTGSQRVFAKRRQCKSRLDVETEYLIMGKDGSTTDSQGRKQYLLDVSTWVEPRPLNCEKTAHTDGCNDFNKFVEEFKISSCKQ